MLVSLARCGFVFIHVLHHCSHRQCEVLIYLLVQPSVIDDFLYNDNVKRNNIMYRVLYIYTGTLDELVQN